MYVTDAVNARIRGLNINGAGEQAWTQVYKTLNEQDVYNKTPTTEAAAYTSA